MRAAEASGEAEGVAAEVVVTETDVEGLIVLVGGLVRVGAADLLVIGEAELVTLGFGEADIDTVGDTVVVTVPLIVAELD